MEGTGPKKILWHSVAPWEPTGYGGQTALFAPRLARAGHDVAISAWAGIGGSTLDWEDGIKVYPADQNYGNPFIRSYAQLHEADVVITLMDAWVLEPAALAELNVACWVPIDHAPCPPAVAQFFRDSRARPIAMSRFGELMLREAGLDPLYVPHGVDTSVFKPYSKAESKAALGVPESAFLVGMVGNNSSSAPPRKAFPQAIEAFAAFKATHPEAELYLHAELSGLRYAKMGINLVDVCELFDVEFRYTSPVRLETGIPPSSMAMLYSAFDVLLNPSYGEGFGVPIIEAQACGTPVIVTDWTSMPELVGAGWKVGGDRWFDPNTAGREHGNAFFKSPSVDAIAAALDLAYEERGSEALSAQAREFALGYDADKLALEEWPAIIEAITQPREVPPLPNREMRRRAAKAGIVLPS